MIAAVDGYEANSANRVGIGRYAFELIDHIARRMASGNPPFDLVRVYLPDEPGRNLPKESENLRYRVTLPKQLWTFLGLPLGLLLDRPLADVVFSPTHYIPRFTRIPRVMAIMDVSYLLYPDLFRARDRVKLVNWTAYSVRHAARIVTISQFSKRAIIEAYHVPEEQVVVAYPALPERIHEPMGKIPESPHLPKRYILSVGTLQPRKNFTRLVEAFSMLSDTDIHLVIVGKKGWLYEDILEAPETYGVKGRVHFLDFVADKDLPGIYKHAEAFVLPSLYEGFGLPVLEAMAHGVPVVVSNSSSLPEIAGEAGIYVDASDVSDISGGIGRALAEMGKAKTDRIALGKKRARAFTWDKAADTVITVLKDVAGKGSA